MAPRSLFKSYGPGRRQRSRPQGSEVMDQSTASHLHEMEKNTIYFEENLPRSVARFDPSEILLENIIGMGEFGTVMEVARVRLKENIAHHRWDCPAPFFDSVESKQIQSPPKKSNETMHRVSHSCVELSLLDDFELPGNDDLFGCQCTDIDFQQQQKLLSRVSSTVTRKGAGENDHCNYAVKQIRKDLYPVKRVEAAKSLAREQKFLQTIHHPNIIRLRGVVGRPGFDNHMMLLDKLEHSLLQQIADWKDQLRSTSFSLLWNSQRTVIENDILSKRLLALYDIAQAVEFLHSKCILFRDLKTENVAKNSMSGAMQLFDFGLAKELKATAKSDDDQYHLTGLTGTLRIMSPEVIQCMPYGLSADVYSFAIITWEVFTGDRNLLAAGEVCKGQRPGCPVAGLPASLETNLLQACWRERPGQRPTATMICKELSSQLLNGSPTNDDPSTIVDRVQLLRQLSVDNISELPP